MRIINIHDAKTHLSRLIEQAVKGESFIIAKSGKPMVQVSPYKSEPLKKKRIGFMPLSKPIPDDFDELGSEEINHLFEGDDK